MYDSTSQILDYLLHFDSFPQRQKSIIANKGAIPDFKTLEELLIHFRECSIVEDINGLRPEILLYIEKFLQVNKPAILCLNETKKNEKDLKLMLKNIM